MLCRGKKASNFKTTFRFRLSWNRLYRNQILAPFRYPAGKSGSGRTLPRPSGPSARYNRVPKKPYRVLKQPDMQMVEHPHECKG